jgi:hypothetical protein
VISVSEAIVRRPAIELRLSTQPLRLPATR